MGRLCRRRGGKNVELRTLRGRKIGGGGNHEWHEGQEWEDGMGRDTNWIRPVLKKSVRFPEAGQPHWRRHSLVSYVLIASSLFPCH